MTVMSGAELRVIATNFMFVVFIIQWCVDVEYNCELFRHVLFIRRRRVRTLYACEAENDSELSFEPNQIITSGKKAFA